MIKKIIKIGSRNKIITVKVDLEEENNAKSLKKKRKKLKNEKHILNKLKK
jgi:hypothetical protein